MGLVIHRVVVNARVFVIALEIPRRVEVDMPTVLDTNLTFEEHPQCRA
jgi:hypothetical protein